VNRYTVASYYAIGTYSVIGSDRSSVASRALGTSPELAEIISEIVYLGFSLVSAIISVVLATVRTWTPAGYVQYRYEDVCRWLLVRLLGWSVGVLLRELERACERGACGSRRCRCRLHGSRFR